MFGMKTTTRWIWSASSVLLATSAIGVVQVLKNRVKIWDDSFSRYVESNGIPDHATGQFPNRGNPNAIAEQRHSYKIPKDPKVAERWTVSEFGPFGVSLNGVPFDPGTAEFWRGDFQSGWRYEALTKGPALGIDGSNAHVQPNGAYHYHGMPNATMNEKGGWSKMVQIGWAFDGFPVYGPLAPSNPNELSSQLKTMRPSYRLKQGTRPSGPGGSYDGTFTADWEFVKGLGDLDEANGRTGVTPEFPKGTYYYVLTSEFPMVPRMWRGQVDPSLIRRPGPGGPGRPPGPPRGGGTTGSDGSAAADTNGHVHTHRGASHSH